MPPVSRRTAAVHRFLAGCESRQAIEFPCRHQLNTPRMHLTWPLIRKRQQRMMHTDSRIWLKDMTNFGLTFHHLGLAVRKPECAMAFVQGLGYVAQPSVFDPEQNVNLILCTHAKDPAIEIIFPGSGPGPVDTLVAKHANGIVYHCCYVTSDLDASLRAISQAGLRPFCVSAPKPAVLFGGARVSFYQVVGVGLIEIIEGSPD